MSSQKEVYRQPVPWKRLAKAALLRLLFPPLLALDILRGVVNLLLGRLISYLVLPAQREKPNPFFDKLALAYAKSTYPSLQFKPITVITYDRAALDGIEISHPSAEKQAISDQRYIINLIGNGQNYEDTLFSIAELANAEQCHVIGFNHRGVSNSTGKPWSENDLVRDLQAQIQRLLDKGVKAENITIKGLSLGGAIGMIATAEEHRNGNKNYVYSSRSLSSITNVLIGAIRERSVALSYVLYPIVWLVLTLAKWNLNAASAYNAIPNGYKDYNVVKPDKNDKQSPRDEVISNYGSLHASQKSQRSAIKKALKRTQNKENVPLQQAYIKAKERKMTMMGDGERKHHYLNAMVRYSAHACPDDMLVSRTDPKLTADKHFARFFHRDDTEQQRTTTPAPSDHPTLGQTG